LNKSQPSIFLEQIRYLNNKNNMKRENPIDLVLPQTEEATLLPRFLRRHALWLALAAATLTLATHHPCGIVSRFLLIHADVVVLEACEPDPDLTEVTAKTFLDIQIDAKPAGWCTVATVKTRC